MSKKVKFKKSNIDPFTNAKDIDANIKVSKKDKLTPTEKNKRERSKQKEIVRQLTDELEDLADKDMLEENSPDKRVNEIVYTIRPVKTKDSI